MAKKILIGIALALASLVALLVAVPFFYDVDTKLRPIILEQIEQNLDVKAELGKLGLNLLWGVNVEIESLKMTENKTKNVLFEMRDSKLRIPYLALLTGKISVTLISDKPAISIVRYSDGSLNITQIMKPSEKKADPTIEAKESGGGIGFAASRIAFATDIKNAFINLKDQQGGFNYKIENLNIKLDDVGVNREFDFNISTDLSINNKKDIKLDGTLSLVGGAELRFNGAGFQALQTNNTLDLTQIEVVYGSLLNKPKGVALKIHTDLEADKSTAEGSLNIKEIEVLAGNLKIITTGTVQDFSKLNLNLNVKSSDFNLKEWKEILGPIRDFDMEGNVSLGLEVQGTSAKPQMNGRFELKGASLKHSALAQRVSDLNMTAQFSGERITFQNTALRIGESDMKLSGFVENLSSPLIKLDLKSKLLDLDKMLPAEKKEKKAGITIMDSAYAQKNPDEDLRQTLAGIQSNPMLQKMDMTADIEVAKIIKNGAVVSDLKGNLYFKNLILTFKNASMKSFGGSAKAFFQMDLSQKAPGFQLTADMLGVDINSAVVSQFKDLDKAITGKANGNMIISGAGIEQAQIKNNLKGSGNFNIKDGAWSGTKPLKILGDKLSGIPKAGEALTKVKISDKFKEFKLDFLIQSGAMIIQKALMDMEGSKTTIDATGRIDFDQNMQIKGNILAPIGDVPKDLKNSDGRGRIPFQLKGKVSAPDVEWEKTLQVVAKAYAKDEGKKIIQKEAEKLLKDDNLKKLLKGFKF